MIRIIRKYNVTIHFLVKHIAGHTIMLGGNGALNPRLSTMGS